MTRPRRPLHEDRPRIGQLSIDEDVRKELDFHVQMCAAELEREGWDLDEARREAERRFGSMTELSKACRKITRSADRAELRAGRLGAVIQDLRYGFRVLRKSPGFAVVAILTLALGIGANTAIFSLVYGVLLKPLPYSDSQRIVAVREFQPTRGRSMSVAAQNFRDWKRGARSFEALTAYSSGTQTIRGGERPLRAVSASVTLDFAAVFRLAPFIGRTFGPEDYDPGAEPVAVIGEDFWTRELGARSIAEIRLDLNGAIHRVVGVVATGFDFPGTTQVWTPLADHNPSRSSHNYEVAGRLADGVSLQQADAELDAIQERLTADERGDDSEFVAEAVDIRSLKEAVAGRAGRPLGLLLGAAGLVLLIACTNLASTLLARGSLRARELTVRQALGASRGRVTAQLLTESGLLAVMGGMVGTGLAFALLAALRVADGVGIPRMEEVSLDVWALGFAVAASLLTGLLFGFLPALRSGGSDPGLALRSGDRSHAQGNRSGLWGALVAAEVALAFVLLSGSLLLVRSFQQVLGTERGFVTVGVMTADVDLNPSRYPEGADHIQFYRLLLQDLEADADIESAGVVSSMPLSRYVPNGRLELDGDLSKRATATYIIASGGYFPAIGIPILQGRYFDDGDRSDGAHVAIVSRSFADRYWPGEDPIGRQVNGGGMDEFWQEGDRRFATVVGVVADARYYQLIDRPEPTVYFPFSQRPGRLQRAATLVTRASLGSAADVVPSFRSLLQRHDPEVPPRFSSMEDRIRGSVAQQRFMIWLLGGFALVAVALAGVGIYGVVSFSVARRTREMGIRLALGGQTGQLRRMVQIQSMRVVLVGAAVGLVAAVGMGRVLESTLFGIKPTDPLTLAASGVTLLFTAWLAATIPALRCTRVDPVTSMRVD